MELGLLTKGLCNSILQVRTFALPGNDLRPSHPGAPTRSAYSRCAHLARLETTFVPHIQAPQPARHTLGAFGPPGNPSRRTVVPHFQAPQPLSPQLTRSVNPFLHHSFGDRTGTEFPHMTGPMWCVPRWPAWKCCTCPAVPHIQAHQPSLGPLQVRRWPARKRLRATHIQAHQHPIPQVRFGPPGQSACRTHTRSPTPASPRASPSPRSALDRLCVTPSTAAPPPLGPLFPENSEARDARRRVYDHQVTSDRRTLQSPLLIRSLPFLPIHPVYDHQVTSD